VVPAKSFFSSLTSSVQYSENTAAGALISQALTETEADTALAPLTDYLNKNFELLCVSLPPSMAQEAIRRIWDETLVILESVVIPPLYGPIDKERRIFNLRQISLLEKTLKILKAFFHADGEGMGIPILYLETTKYLDISNIISRYNTDIPRLKRECELGIQSGRNKEAILRLVRLLFEKSDSIEASEKEDHRKWLLEQIETRKRLA
jgi:hypothetical protein